MPEVTSYNDLLFEVYTNYSKKIYPAYLLPNYFKNYNNLANVRIASFQKISETHYKLILESLNGIIRLVWIEFKSKTNKINNSLCKIKYKNKNCTNNVIYHYFDDNGFSMTKTYRSINFYIFLEAEKKLKFNMTITVKNFQIKAV